MVLSSLSPYPNPLGPSFQFAEAKLIEFQSDGGSLIPGQYFHISPEVTSPSHVLTMSTLFLSEASTNR